MKVRGNWDCQDWYKYIQMADGFLSRNCWLSYGLYIVIRFHEKYSWLLKETLSDFTKQELFSPKNQDMEGLSYHFCLWNIFPSLPYFLLLGVYEVKTTDRKPRTSCVWSYKKSNLPLWLRQLPCWLQSIAHSTCSLISSFYISFTERKLMIKYYYIRRENTWCCITRFLVLKLSLI